MADSFSPGSTRPYMIRAWHEWCSDNGLTPYLLVKVDSGVSVPHEFVQNGEIVLNIGMEATGALALGNDEVRFKARFSGRVREIIVPVACVKAIYARETGQGMEFEMDEDAVADASGAATQQAPASDAPPAASGLNVVHKNTDAAAQPAASTPGEARRDGSSTLRIVK